MTLFVGNFIVLFKTFRVLHRCDGKIPPTFYGSGVSRIECIVILSILQGGHFPVQPFVFHFSFYNSTSVSITPNWTSYYEFLLTSGGTLFYLPSRSISVLAGPELKNHLITNS